MPFVITIGGMKKKRKKFQLRLHEEDRDLLHRLADQAELSAGEYLRKYITREAKKKGLV